MRSFDDDFEVEPRIRPPFLTILCILTFAGSSLAIISAVFAYQTADKSGSMFSKIAYGNRNNRNATVKDSTYLVDSAMVSDSILKNEKAKSSSAFDKKMEASVAKMFTKENIQKKSIGDFISSIFTLIGAILMWHLRRPGFYLYVLGVLISLFVPMYLFGTDLMAIGLSIIASFFGIVFVALYALNLKAMKSNHDEELDFG